MASEKTEAEVSSDEQILSERSVKNRRVYMKYEKCLGVWRVNFVVLDGGGGDLKELRFTDEEKIVRVAERAGALKDLACRQGLWNGIGNGLGGITMMLTPEQFGRLTVR
jgi:hypothetical protein